MKTKGRRRSQNIKDVRGMSLKEIDDRTIRKNLSQKADAKRIKQERSTNPIGKHSRDRIDVLSRTSRIKTNLDKALDNNFSVAEKKDGKITIESLREHYARKMGEARKEMKRRKLR